MEHHKAKILTLTGFIGLIADVLTIVGVLGAPEKIPLAFPVFLTAFLLFLFPLIMIDALRNPHDYGLIAPFLKDLLKSRATKSMALIGIGAVGGLLLCMLPTILVLLIAQPSIDARWFALIGGGAGCIGALFGFSFAMVFGVSSGDIPMMPITQVANPFFSKPAIIADSIQSQFFPETRTLKVKFEVNTQFFVGKTEISIQYALIQNGKYNRHERKEVIDCGLGKTKSKYELTLHIPQGSHPVESSVEVTIPNRTFAQAG